MFPAARHVVCTCDDCTPKPSVTGDRLTLAVAIVGFALVPGRALFHLLMGAL